jgi:hypothetical protein
MGKIILPKIFQRREGCIYYINGKKYIHTEKNNKMQGGLTWEK